MLGFGWIFGNFLLKEDLEIVFAEKKAWWKAAWRLAEKQGQDRRSRVRPGQGQQGCGQQGLQALREGSNPWCGFPQPPIGDQHVNKVSGKSQIIYLISPPEPIPPNC